MENSCPSQTKALWTSQKDQFPVIELLLYFL